MERVRPDMSIRLNYGDESVLVDRVYDNVHIFDWLGYGLLKLVTQDGYKQIPLTVEQAQEIANAAGITPVYRPEISEAEHEHYLRVQAQNLEDMFKDMGEAS